MNRITVIVFAFVWFCQLVPGQEHLGPAQSSQRSGFVIDATKPYVYLEVDHVGPRKRIDKSEPDIGIFLRLNNNSRLPIIVSTFGAQPGSREEVGLMDEVVPNLKMQGTVAIGNVPTPAMPKGSQSEPPAGYTWDVRTTMSIPPGGKVFFSLPFNHVGPTWHFEIPFRFDLPKTKQLQPKSCVVFFENDLPPKDRP